MAVLALSIAQTISNRLFAIAQGRFFVALLALKLFMLAVQLKAGLRCVGKFRYRELLSVVTKLAWALWRFQPELSQMQVLVTPFAGLGYPPIRCTAP